MCHLNHQQRDATTPTNAAPTTPGSVTRRGVRKSTPLPPLPPLHPNHFNTNQQQHQQPQKLLQDSNSLSVSLVLLIWFFSRQSENIFAFLHVSLPFIHLSTPHQSFIHSLTFHPPVPPSIYPLFCLSCCPCVLWLKDSSLSALRSKESAAKRRPSIWTPTWNPSTVWTPRGDRTPTPQQKTSPSLSWYLAAPSLKVRLVQSNYICRSLILSGGHQKGRNHKLLLVHSQIDNHKVVSGTALALFCGIQIS